jgi:hypothetical protein
MGRKKSRMLGSADAKARLVYVRRNPENKTEETQAVAEPPLQAASSCK